MFILGTKLSSPKWGKKKKESFLLYKKYLSARKLGNHCAVQARRLSGSFAKFPYFTCYQYLLGPGPSPGSQSYHCAKDKGTSGV